MCNWEYSQCGGFIIPLPLKVRKDSVRTYLLAFTWICAELNVKFPTLYPSVGGWVFLPDVTRGSVGKFIRMGT